jgi:hypothetical protein
MTSPKFMQRMVEWFDKHANPIALLETQQVLSLKRTMIVFGLLILALWMGSCAVIEETSGGGEEMSLLLLATYSIVSILVVPAQILFNSANRWSKDKLEMLHLTQLRPMDIVLGRVLSGAGLLLILGAAIVPFVALTYLMPGTQIQLVLLGMGFVFMMGLITILFTLNISWRLEEYSFASIGKVLWFLIVLQGTFGVTAVVVSFVENVSTNELEDLLLAAPWMVAVWGLFVYFGIAQSVLLFRHPESNRSTPYRVGVFAAYVLGMLAILTFKGLPGTLPKESFIFCLLAMGACGLSCLPLMLEDEVIGRKAFVELPKKRLHRILMFPLLPSAGSGMVFLTLMLTGILLVAPWSVVSENEFTALIYTPLQGFAFVATLLPRLRKLDIVSKLSKRNLIVAAYMPVVAAPFGFLSFLARDPAPLEWMVTRVFPLAAMADGFRSGTIAGMEMWAGLCACLCVVVNRDVLRSSWNIVVSKQHPAFQMANEPVIEASDEAV